MDDKASIGPVEFAVPESFNPPEGKNGEFELVCSFKANDGKICMTKFGDLDVKIPGEKDDKPGYHAYSKDLSEAGRTMSGNTMEGEY